MKKSEEIMLLKQNNDCRVFKTFSCLKANVCKQIKEIEVWQK
jgi:hypothetical protein